MKSKILSLAFLLLGGALCFAQDDLPANYPAGWYQASNSVPATVIRVIPHIANPPVTGGPTAIAEAITPRITALARNQLDDPTRIYDYVHDHIRYVHYFGSHKGAEMTLLEKSGNDFDQCALLVALLRAAGFSPTYEFGMVGFPYSSPTSMDYQHWIGTVLPNTNWNATVQLVDNINGNVGFPYLATLSGDTTNLYFHHTWVQLTIGGTNFVLDPSFKVGTAISGINIHGAAGINTNTLVSDAGGTTTPDYVQGLGESAIRADLTTFATTLRNYLQNNMPNDSVQQVIGGETITPCTGLNQPVAFTVQTLGGNWPTSAWSDIPTNLLAVFIVALPGTTSSTNILYVPGLQANRLSLVCTSTGQAQLYQEDTQIASVQTTGGTNTTFSPTLTFQHPFGSWDFSSTNGLVRSGWADQTLNQALYQRTNANYSLLYGFDVNASWLTARQDQLDLYRQQGYSDTSPQVTKETLNVMGLNWLTQTELASQILAGQTVTLNHYLHRIGRMGQETGKGYYIDVYGQILSTLSTDQTNLPTFNENQSFQLSGYFGSALEHGIIEELQNSGLTAASTVKVLELASTNGQRIYLANSTNWSSGASVVSHLANYDTSSLYNTYIQNGYYLLLPTNGSVQVAGAGSWAGSGYVAYVNEGNGFQSIAMYIGSGYNGGYVSSPSALPSPSTIATIDASQPLFFASSAKSVGRFFRLWEPS